MESQRTIMRFAGFVFALSSEITQRQRQIIVPRIENAGGQVLPPPVASLFTRFQKATVTPTHFVVDSNESSITEDRILKYLQVPDIPSDLKIIKLQWVNDCLENDTLQPTSSYEMNLNLKKRNLEYLNSKVHNKASGGSSRSQKRLAELRAMFRECRNTFILPENEIPTAINSSWVRRNDIVYRFDEFAPTNPTEVIAFDMDGTLIKTRSGKKYPVNSTDWQWFSPNVLTELCNAYDRGAYLAIISNQNGVKSGKVSVDELIEKIDRMRHELKQFYEIRNRESISQNDKTSDNSKQIGIDAVFCIDDKTMYRKPSPGMIEFLMRSRQISTFKRYYDLDESDVESVSTASSSASSASRAIRMTYVGDAAGRFNKSIKDHSDVDLKFAKNANMKFLTPEVFFLKASKNNERVRVKTPRLCEPIEADSSTEVDVSHDDVCQPKYESEMVIMVAPPSCGKSYVSRRLAARGYHRVNQDSLGTFDNCMKSAKEYIESRTNGQPIRLVIDNTNVNVTTRAKWIELASQHQIRCRCIMMDIPKEICLQLLNFRLMDPNTPNGDRRHIDKIVIHTFYKRLHEAVPSIEEGFHHIDRLRWKPIIPTALVSKKLFCSYLI